MCEVVCCGMCGSEEGGGFCGKFVRYGSWKSLKVAYSCVHPLFMCQVRVCLGNNAQTYLDAQASSCYDLEKGATLVSWLIRGRVPSEWRFDALPKLSKTMRARAK